jgi:hypothetical protein
MKNDPKILLPNAGTRVAFYGDSGVVNRGVFTGETFMPDDKSFPKFPSEIEAWWPITIDSEQSTADLIRQALKDAPVLPDPQHDSLTTAKNHAAALIVWSARTWQKSENRQEWAAALYVKVWAEDILQTLNELKAGEPL